MKIHQHLRIYAMLWNVILSFLALGQSVPSGISFQGRLTGPGGQGMSPGSYTLQFRIWDSMTSPSGKNLWSNQQVVNVESNGVFTVILGLGGNIPIPGETVPFTDLMKAFGDGNRFLGITVAAINGVQVISATEIAPRQQLLSVPFSISALNAQTAVNVVNGIPSGTVLSYAGATVPRGYLWCDGSAQSSAQYPDLFAAIGTTWGAGGAAGMDFNLPDFQSRFLLGGGGGSGLTRRSLGSKGGEEMHKLTIAEMPSHTHHYFWYGPLVKGFSGNSTSAPRDTYQQVSTDPAGEDQPHNIVPPFAVVNYIIKY